MVKSRLLYLILSVALIAVIAGGFLALPNPISAQDTPTPTPAATPTPTPPPAPAPSATPEPTPTKPAPKLTMQSDVPSYADDSGATFSYDVVLKYDGDDRITVNLATTDPQGWQTYITYSSKQVSSIEIGPMQYGSADSKTLTVYLLPDTGQTPDPGEYKLTLKASSAKFNLTQDLVARVKAKYSFSLTTDSGNLTTQATAGKENHFSFNMVNGGTASLDKLTLTTDKPQGWVITFKPETVDSISAGQTQQEDVVITPPEGKTIAGDYLITIKASNDKVNQSMQVRVTVLTPSIWGWVGIIIIVVVIAGLAVLFMKLGRR